MNLKQRLEKEIYPEISKKFGIPVLALPKISKVTVNTGVGRIKESKDEIESIAKELSLITGQKPKYTQAKESISGFKLRKGQIVGLAVTLRGDRMLAFLERLVNVVLPRSREFEGVSQKCFDRNNNLTISIKEQNIFPELKIDDIKQIWGMGISISIKNSQNKEAVTDLLKAVGFIFEEEK